MTADEKAKLLLAEGRLWVRLVDGDTVMAECRGYTGDYTVEHLSDVGWRCTCPANAFYGRECSHIKSLYLCTTPTRVRELVVA